jgi:1-acyl-sn-glycerol-3-phosphate acyltransferase
MWADGRGRICDGLGGPVDRPMRTRSTRVPRDAASRASASATIDFPVPPLPVTKRTRAATSRVYAKTRDGYRFLRRRGGALQCTRWPRLCESPDPSRVFVAREGHASHDPPVAQSGADSPKRADGATKRADGATKQPRSGGSSSIGDIFLARLGDLERRVERELDRPVAGGGALGELALDVAREAWRVGSTLASAASSLAGGRSLVASLLAGPPLDDVGLDADLAATTREIIRPLARRWLGFRELAGAFLPAKGGVLVLLNRSAWPLPVEALVLWAFLHDGRIGDRRLFVLWDDDLLDLPWVGDFLRRIGVSGATEENARVLLERGAVVLAFPEGKAARARTYERRYRLARFEARGVVAAALEAGARIVPGAVVGSEESFPLLGSVMGLPLTPQFPLFGPLGLLPLPVAWRLKLGAPVEYAIQDDEAPPVDAICDAVRARMQAIVGELLAQRSSILRG